MNRNDDRNGGERREGPDRAQVILIGAITLAFIILGVVVVFNGVLYTETLSSAATSQSASGAATVDAEVQQGVSCLVAAVNDDDDVDGDELNETVEEEVEAFGDSYRNSTANSKPVILDVSFAEDSIEVEGSGEEKEVTELEVIVQHSSNDVTYTRTMTIDPADCPDNGG